jgi:hypothetical protein
MHPLHELARKFLVVASLAAAAGCGDQSGLFIRRAENAIRFTRRERRRLNERRPTMN